MGRNLGLSRPKSGVAPLNKKWFDLCRIISGKISFEASYFLSLRIDAGGGFALRITGKFSSFRMFDFVIIVFCSYLSLYSALLRFVVFYFCFVPLTLISYMRIAIIIRLTDIFGVK